MMKKNRYIVENLKWIDGYSVTDSDDPDLDLGTFIAQCNAKKVSTMLNQRIELLAMAERLSAWGRMDKPLLNGLVITSLIHEANAAIAKTKGGGE